MATRTDFDLFPSPKLKVSPYTLFTCPVKVSNFFHKKKGQKLNYRKPRVTKMSTADYNQLQINQEE